MGTVDRIERMSKTDISSRCKGFVEFLFFKFVSLLSFNNVIFSRIIKFAVQVF